MSAPPTRRTDVALALAAHYAVRIHVLKLHREAFDRCQDWECALNRAQLEAAGGNEERR